eukprot:302373-Chlamydomonas_euryale.AAC.1
MAVLTAGVTSEGTSQGCRVFRLKSWTQALSAWQFIMGFRGILWAPFTLTLTVGSHAPWLQRVQHACCICNMCMHDADLRNRQRAARALAFAVAAKCERRFERTTGPNRSGGGSHTSTRGSLAMSLCPRTENVVYP